MSGLSITQMRSGIRKATGSDVDDLPDTDIDLYLNRALWEIDNKFPFKEKEKTVTFPLITGTRNYLVPVPYEAVKSLAVFGRYDDHSHPLEYMQTADYDAKYSTNDYDQGQPKGYTRENNYIKFWPTPDWEYVVNLKRLIILDDISDSNPAVNIPRVWHEIIQYGGLWRALIDFGDFARANQVKNHQISLINSTVPTETKEEGHDKFAGLEVAREDYDGYRWWSNQ